MNADVYLVGLGIGGPDRMTCEARTVLEGATTVLHLSAIDADLRRLCRGKVISLIELYGSSDDAAAIYASITRAIVDSTREARQHGGYAAYATYGHPLLIEDSSRQAIRLCDEESLRWKVVPGLSCFDTLLVDSPARLDGGAQLLDARQFVAYRLTIEPRVPLVLLEIGDLESETLRPDPNDVSRFAALEERLQSLYPKSHPAHTVFSAYKAGVASRVRSATIGTLSSLWPAAHTGSTLVIPRLTRR